MVLVVTTVRGSALWLYEQVRFIIFAREVNPAVLHIPWVKATSVNGSGAAELSQFRVGAAELRGLEGMQVKVGEGVSEGVGAKNRETAKNETEGMRRRRVRECC